MKGFYIDTIAGGDVTQMEYLPAGKMVVSMGEALTVTGGKLAVATGKPSYISAYDSQNKEVDEGTLIPCFRVLDEMIFRTSASAALTGVEIGEKVTISADGTQVTATTASGVAEIVSKDGDEAGDTVRVRF